MKCNRTACKVELTDTYVNIWNEPKTGLPNIYCVSCAKGIIRYNPTLKKETIVAGKAYPPIENITEEQLARAYGVDAPDKFHPYHG